MLNVLRLIMCVLRIGCVCFGVGEVLCVRTTDDDRGVAMVRPVLRKRKSKLGCCAVVYRNEAMAPHTYKRDTPLHLWHVSLLRKAELVC